MARVRDYKREYELQKGKRNDVAFSTRVLKQTAKDFDAKIEFEGISRNTFLRACIECFLNDEITLEQLHLK